MLVEIIITFFCFIMGIAGGWVIYKDVLETQQTMPIIVAKLIGLVTSVSITGTFLYIIFIKG